MNRISNFFKITVLMLIITSSFQSACYAIPIEPSSELNLSDLQYQASILHYVNEYRIKHHLKPLKMVNVISQEAAKHSRDMANKSIPFGHQYFDTRIKHLYKAIHGCNGGAENVAYYKLNAKKLVDGWIASPGHRRNIEGNYNLTGIGIARSKKGWAYFTQIFLRSDSINS